ncbi:hypothetical protein TPHA_0I01810 [Tetrapisispora phaffii CBS 4417]|uniref:tRNA-splicing endonuclease subunit Sen54 N-terminal domain-containing protein n=1 Tax=Tetrapisispora phaffii (strain ATCC 24235 / CBS 4417 / NBRC 1672 / NRRL Y-8282 / UCD 70-5) TaxID=1071381 RepID=G8BXQ7_TETPH|nr:hypothetical protein TPHA_0I01810 [Tetrapisispora phaffii CBS 4417]CCE64685.1 hypothetical protein TPHA_0I01810 [Tetrapisispora phaffii CBS 4417]
MEKRNGSPIKYTHNKLNKETDGATSELEEDEVIQDWSQLAKLSKKNSLKTLPKRGEKDYEPDGTIIQEGRLFQVRKAMFDTLYNSIRGSTIKNQSKAFLVPELHSAFILHAKGNFLQTVGKVDKQSRCWLNFLEFVYLAERGTITPFLCSEYHNSMTTEDDMDIVPLSIEDIYTFFESQVEINEFFVYGYLKRLGYIVNLKKMQVPDPTSFFPSTLNKWTGYFNVINLLSFTDRLFTDTSKMLRKMVFFSSYNFKIFKYLSNSMIYNGLQTLINCQNVPKNKSELYSQRIKYNRKPTLHNKQKISFDVWKPQSNYKKKSPGLPDYQIMVMNKNDPKQHFPSKKELDDLFDSLDYKFEFLNNSEDTNFWERNSYTCNIPREDYLLKSHYKAKQVNSSLNSVKQKKVKRPISSYNTNIQQILRLKHGYRNILIAVIDNGIISFIKIGEADFGKENIWYVPNSKLNK